MRVIVPCTLMLLMALPGAANAVRPDETLSLSEIAGRWAAQDYLERVKASRQGFASEPETFMIRSSTRGWMVDWTNFNELDRYWIEAPESARRGWFRIPYRLDKNDTRETALVWVTRSDDGAVQELRFENRGLVNGVDRVFVRIPKALDSLVNEWVLAGRYVDERGKAYDFSPDRQARWPDTTFRYRLSLDSLSGDCDHWIREGQPATADGFRRDGDTLLVYQAFVAKDGSVACDDTPRLRLSRVKN